jgi:hypothetical protein
MFAKKHGLGFEVALIVLLIPPVIFGTCFVSLAQESSEPEVTASVTQADGLETVEFDTLTGTVEVNLPDDLSESDTISGTVLVEPKGETKEEIAESEDTLRGYVVEIAETEEVQESEIAEEPQPEEKKSSPAQEPIKQSTAKPVHPKSAWDSLSKPHVSKPIHKPTVVEKPKHSQPKICSDPPSIYVSPKEPSSYTCRIPRNKKHVTVVIKNSRGGEVCRKQVACKPKPPQCPTLKMPTQANCGGRLRIPGKCDGRSSTSKISVNRKRCRILAESPRQQVCQAPLGLKGPCRIERNESGSVICGTITMLPPKPTFAQRKVLPSRAPAKVAASVPASVPAPPKRTLLRRTGPFIEESQKGDRNTSMTCTANQIVWTAIPAASRTREMSSSTFSFSELPETLTPGDRLNFTGQISGDPRMSPVGNFYAGANGGGWVKVASPLITFNAPTYGAPAGFVPSGTQSYEVVDAKKMWDDYRRTNPAEYQQYYKPGADKQFECVLSITNVGGRAEYKWIYVLEDQ